MSGLLFMGCRTIKPYEKEYLLHPLMDDVTTNRLDARMMNTAGLGVERLTGTAGSNVTASSCPTCGG
jgi:hypothetical protein